MPCFKIPAILIIMVMAAPYVDEVLSSSVQWHIQMDNASQICRAAATCRLRATTIGWLWHFVRPQRPKRSTSLTNNFEVLVCTAFTFTAIYNSDTMHQLRDWWHVSSYDRPEATFLNKYNYINLESCICLNKTLSLVRFQEGKANCSVA